MIFLIGIGGIIGTLLRYYLGKWITSRASRLYPWGTFLINLSGSFLLGWLYSLKEQGAVPEWAWLFFGIGFCGGYTTFSTFSYEAVQLIKSRNTMIAAFYVVGTVLAGLLCCWIGTKFGLIPI